VGLTAIIGDGMPQATVKAKTDMSSFSLKKFKGKRLKI
jgi:hypothetical protein